MQGRSTAVMDAVGASLLGAKAPFRLIRNPSCSGSLEASTMALRKWLLSEHFLHHNVFFQVCACLLSVSRLPTHSQNVQYVRLYSILADYRLVHARAATGPLV